MRHLLFAFALSLLAVLPGCLEFDSQEVTVHHDVAQDRIDLLFVYRGLFVEGSGDGDQMQEAIDDLDRALATGTFAFWCNWPLKANPTVQGNGVLRVLQTHVDVENGGLFTDPLGQLCGYQFVRIRDASAFLAKVETALQLAAQGAQMTGLDSQGGGKHKLDEDTRDALREFMRERETFLNLTPGRIELRLPCSAADHRWLKQQIEHQASHNAAREVVRRYGVKERRAAGGSPRHTTVQASAVVMPGEAIEPGLFAAPSMRFFWDNEFSFDHRQGLTTIALGTGEGEVRVVKSSEGLYHDELLLALRERGDKIEDGVPDQEIERRFAAFHGRDAVLPPLLGQMRSSAEDR